MGKTMPDLVQALIHCDSITQALLFYKAHCTHNVVLPVTGSTRISQVILVLQGTLHPQCRFNSYWTHLHYTSNLVLQGTLDPQCCYTSYWTHLHYIYEAHCAPNVIIPVTGHTCITQAVLFYKEHCTHNVVFQVTGHTCFTKETAPTMLFEPQAASFIFPTLMHSMHNLDVLCATLANSLRPLLVLSKFKILTIKFVDIFPVFAFVY